MSILVVCPGCRKSFKVSDNFAGRSGPCPKCKTVIQVPEKAQEVVVHAPTEFASGGRSVSGKLVTKPIARERTKLQPVAAAVVAAATVGVLLVAYLAGGAIRGNLLVRAAGLLLISPVLAFAPYPLLRDDELEPYRGLALYVRIALCAAAYAALWGLFAYVAVTVPLSGEMWEWLVAIPFLVVGAMVASALLDLGVGNGLLHYGFYLLATMLLRGAAGMPPVWQFASGSAPGL